MRAVSLVLSDRINKNAKLTHTHDVGLRADGHQTVDVLADRHENLSGHMAALLGAGSLVLDMDTSSSALHEELGQLHDRRQATVTGIGVSNDGTQIVHIRHVGTLLLRGCHTLLALFPIMEQLRHEELVDLVGDSVLVRMLADWVFPHQDEGASYHRVISQIRRRLVGGRSG